MTNSKNDLTSDLPYEILKIVERPLGRYSTVGNQTFHSTDQFPWTRILEENWLDIREELQVILQKSDKIPAFQEILKGQAKLTEGTDWKTFIFYGYGHKLERNCQKCPKTTTLIERIPGMKTAFFSILAPHKHIPPHRGPYKGVLRYHLGLKIPDAEACKIRVGDDYGYWQEGKSLIFDDSFEHEAWNNTNETRVVLFVDFMRPLSFPVSLVNEAIVKLISLTPFVRSSIQKHYQWEKAMAQSADS